MAEPAYTSVHDQSSAETEKVEKILMGFMTCRSRRYNFELQWQESANIFLPDWANKFFFGYDEQPGMKKTQYQIEAYPSIAAHRFAAIANSLITPWTMVWSRIKADNDYLMKQRGVKPYFAQVSKVLWQERYKAESGFLENQLTNWLSLGVFGNQSMFVEERYSKEDGSVGLAYIVAPIGHVYYVTNHQGRICGFYRTLKLNAHQIKERWPDTFPPELEAPLRQHSKQPYWVVQTCMPNEDYDPTARAHPTRGKRWYSCYVSMQGKRILEEGGYRLMPMPSGRYMVAPDEDYGRGPAQIVLAGAKSMQAMKGAYLKQTHRKGDPVLLTPDGGLTDGSQFRPGDVVEGGMDGEGHPLVGVLPTGDPQEIVEAMAREQQMIDDGFLVSLFQMALKTEDQPQLSVRQMMEIIEQRAQLLGPSVGRQMMEYLGSMIPRELDILAYQGKLPPQPPVIREAKGEFKIEYDNPLQRAMAAGDAAAFMQAVEMAAQVANTSQDATVWDVFNFKRAIPAIAEARGAPAEWMATPQEMAAAARNRAQQAEREAQAKELPARAAIIKAQAVATKAATGGNIGGTLSGVAPGGMPSIPGNAPGLPGRPGVGGRPGLSGRPAPR